MPPSNYRDGLVVRGRRRSWPWLRRHMVCRQCRALIGRPYIDHISGDIDHERTTCAGPERHIIEDEGDLMPRGQHEWLAREADWQLHDVRSAYGLVEAMPNASRTLYGDDEFEGFA